jgi:hypothetical protein
VIRFSAFLVAVAVGLLVAGVVTSKLMLVYVAIGVSGVALLALAVGALVKRKELFGPSTSAEPQLAQPEPAAVPVSPGQPAPQAVPWGATVPVASAWPVAAAQPAPSRAGYLPTEQPLPPRPQPRPAEVPRRPAAFTPRPPAGPPSPAQGVPAPGPSAWEWPPDAPATQELPRIGAAPAPPPPAAPPEWPAPAAAFVPKLASPPPEAAEPSPASESQPPPAALDEPVAHDEPPAEDQPPAEQTQQLPVAASTATDAPPPEGPDTPEALDTVDVQREVTVVPGVPRYHNPHCLLIRFMGQDDLEKMTLGAARQAGCTPCRACLPDQAEADPELGPPEPERQAEVALDVLPRRLGLRTRRRTRTRPRLDREDLAGDQPRVLGKGRDHIRVL